MLSRIAESLYWIGRYCERAEGTARLLDVHYHLLLEERGITEADACRLLVEMMGIDSHGLNPVPEVVTGLLAYDTASPISILTSVSSAWDNARGAREAVSAEFWQTLNAMHQEAELYATTRIAMPHSFFTWIMDRAAALTGLAESTMSHDDGWRFMVLGRSLERADLTTRVLRAASSDVLGRGRWTTMLRSCTAHTAYLRKHRRRVDAQRAVEFLMLDPLFPRSLRHTLGVAAHVLDDLNPRSERTGSMDETQRRIGRAIADLEYTPASELIANLDMIAPRIQHHCAAVHEAVAARYFLQANAIAWSAE
jgi:uncharacterized alpha-E superfamily protein